MPGVHRKQVAHTHRLKIGARGDWRIIREELQHLIVDAQLSFRDGHSHGSGSEALAQRIQLVIVLRAVWLPPTFGDNVAVPHQHETVHRIDLIEVLDQCQHGG